MFWGQNGSRNEEYEKGENQGEASPYSSAFFDFIKFFFVGTLTTCFN